MELVRTELMREEPVAEFVRAMLAAVPFRFVGGVRIPQGAHLFLEDRGAAILALVRMRPVAPAGERLTMEVLVEGEPAQVAELAASQGGRVVANPRQAVFRYGDFITGDDAIGFAGALRRLTRHGTGKLAGEFGPDLGGFGLPPGTDAAGFGARLRAALRQPPA